MMLYLGRGGMVRGRVGLGVVHVTLHVAMRDALAAVTTNAVLEKIHLANRATGLLLAGSGDAQPPQIGVCALNPHGGEQGLFGDEEQRIIAPAIEQAQAAGINAIGPLPADTLLSEAAAGRFDAVVAMYHDQGHIALKLIGLHRAVNVTLGLPIVRTSVAHGTAFDVAWQGNACSQSMVEAMLLAAQLAKSRNR